MQQPGLKQKIVGGIGWLSFSQIVRHILQFFFIVLLARILSVDDFGIMAIISAFLALSLSLGDLGLSAAIVQRKNIEDMVLSTCVWLCLAAGVFFFLVASSLSGLIAQFFKQKIIGPLIAVFSLKFIIDSLGMVHEALLRKDLLFRRLSFIEISETLVFGLVALSLAFRQFGVWSLVFGYLLAGSVKVLLLWFALAWRPHLYLSLRGFEDFFSFAKNIFGFKIISYLVSNIDRFVIGKLLGSVSLGYYAMAFNVANLPREKISNTINRVGFPVLSKFQEDTASLKSSYLEILTFASLIIFPLLCGLMLVAGEFVQVVFTQKWLPMAIPLQYLCLAGIFSSITSFSGAVFLSTGHAEFELRLALISLGGMLLAISSGIKFGLSGVSLSLAGYSFAINIIAYFMVAKLIKLKISDYLRVFYPASLSCLIMLVWLKLFLVYAQKFFIFSPLFLLLCSIGTGAVIYSLSLYFIKPSLFRRIIDICRRKNVRIG